PAGEGAGPGRAARAAGAGLLAALSRARRAGRRDRWERRGDIMTAAPSGHGNRGDGLRLLVPKGWALSDLVAARLRRQLERAPAHVTAVVAALGDLLPASSYRSQAEHLVVEPMTSVSEVPAGALLGAAVVRPGVRCKLEDD